MLPKPNKLPTTTYEAKHVVCPLGLEIKKIHACPKDCILYRGKDYENLDECPYVKHHGIRSVEMTLAMLRGKNVPERKSLQRLCGMLL